MIPQGMPAKVCSAFWQRSAFCTPDTFVESMAHSCSRNVAVATLYKISRE